MLTQNEKQATFSWKNNPQSNGIVFLEKKIHYETAEDSVSELLDLISGSPLSAIAALSSELAQNMLR